MRVSVALFVCTTLAWTGGCGDSGAKSTSASKSTDPGGTSPQASADQKRLQGVWTAIRRERNGVDEVPPGGVRLTFRGDRVVFQHDGSRHAQKYRLNAAAKPRQIDIVSDSEAVHGIYEFDGGRLKLCLSEAGPNYRPRSFSTASDPDSLLIVLTQSKPQL